MEIRTFKSMETAFITGRRKQARRLQDWEIWDMPLVEPEVMNPIGQERVTCFREQPVVRKLTVDTEVRRSNRPVCAPEWYGDDAKATQAAHPCT